MKWNSLSEFISMGGYGVYVWGSYGVTLVLLAAELISLRARKRRVVQMANNGEVKGQDSNLQAVL